MVQIMTNIPRRKIYETMLEFEEALMDMQIILYNEENFSKYMDMFNSKAKGELSVTYSKIKALLIMFFENRKFKEEENFEDELNKIISENTTQILVKNENLPKTFCDVLVNLDKKLKNIDYLIKDFNKTKEVYDVLDKFNHYIPKLLEIRRDHMK